MPKATNEPTTDRTKTEPTTNRIEIDAETDAELGENWEATLVVVCDRKTGQEVDRYLINKRPATKSFYDYMTPAVEFLEAVLRK